MEIKPWTDDAFPNQREKLGLAQTLAVILEPF
jgi:hypothetical protein